MSEPRAAPPWQPVTTAERYAALDVIRGLALLGVLLVNLHSNFRVSLAEHILTFHASPGWIDRATDVAIAALLEFKAFSLFSLLFGAGMAIFADRAAQHDVNPNRFLVRRFLVLLALGLGHLYLIWNGDILTLYALCGLLLLPFLQLPAAALVATGVAAFVIPYVIPWGLGGPSEETMRELGAEAGQVYATGGFQDVLEFHWRETHRFILPLVVGVLPRTLGLMALGAAAWRAGLFQNPNEHRRLLWTVALIGSTIGGTATLLAVLASSTGQPTGVPPGLVEAFSSAPLALAYAAGLVLALESPSVIRAAAPFAAVGQMALTNYLIQSVVLSLLFYGYGLGLHGRLGSAAAAGVGLIVYAGQMVCSRVWLQRARFGPVEWLWRSLTYGRSQPLWRPPIS